MRIKADGNDQAFDEGYKKGREIEKEHKGMIQKLKEYYDKSKTLPPDSMIYDWIALDHLKETPFYYGPEFDEFERLVKEKENVASNPEQMNQAVANILRCNEIKAMLQNIDMNKLEAAKKKIKSAMDINQAEEIMDIVKHEGRQVAIDKYGLSAVEEAEEVINMGHDVPTFEARLVQRSKDGEQHWALISKDSDKVLEWFGKDKPSDERVKKSEARVQMFKHMKGDKARFAKTKDGWVVRILRDHDHVYSDTFTVKYVDGPNIGEEANIEKDELEMIKSNIKALSEPMNQDLEVGKVYDRALLENMGFEFGAETAKNIVIWEPDGDGWYAIKIGDNEYKVIRQYYEGTENMKKMREQVYSKKIKAAAIEQYLANAIKEYLKKQGRPNDMVEVSKYDMNEIEAIVGNDVEYFTYDELGVSHEEIEDLMAEPTVAKIKAFGPTDPAMEDDIERRALRLAYRFKAEIREIMRKYKNPSGQYDKAVKVITQILNER